MRLKKKLLLLFLAVVLCIAPVLCPISSNAFTDTLTAEQLKAKYYTTSPLFMKYANANFDSPYHNYITEMMNTDGFEAGLIAWQTANFFLNPGDLLEGALKEDILSEKGYYEAMLFEMLYEAQRKDAFLDKIDSTVKKLNVSTYKDLGNAYKSVFELSYFPSKNTILTDEELQKVKNIMLEQTGTYYIDIFGTIETFENVISKAKTIEGISNKVSTLVAFHEIGQSHLAVLEEMYNSCENEHLQDAISEMIQYYENNFSVECIVEKELDKLVLDKILDEACGLVWDDIVNNLGGGWVKLASTVGKAASNAWLSTDSYYESFYQMRSLLDIEGLVKSVIREANQEYSENPTDENAVFLNDCIEVAMCMQELSYEYSAQYLSMLDERGIINVMTALGMEGLDNTALIQRFHTERNTVSMQYTMAEYMLDELGQQEQAGYEDAYSDASFDINSQAQFDIYINLCKDMQNVITDRTTNLRMNCTTSVTATDTDGCTIGSLSFTTLRINGDKIISKGYMSGKNLYLNNSQLEVGGDLTLVAVKEMLSEEALLHVKGDFTVGGTSLDTSTMTNGTVKLEGDFILDGVCGYNPTENCKTIFCGSGLQSVKGKFDRIYNTSLGNVLIQSANFTMADITGDMPSMTLIGNINLENAGVIKAGSLTLTGNEINTAGSIECTTLKAGNTDNTITAVKGATATNINVNNGKLIINGDVVGANLYLNDGQLEVGGDLTLSAVKEMLSEEAILHVKGDFTVGGTSADTSTMTNGTVKLEGDFILDGFCGYNPTENCKTIFCGSELQSVKGKFDRIYNTSLGNVLIQSANFTMADITGDMPSITLIGDINLENAGVIKAGSLTLTGNEINTAGSIECTTLKAKNTDNTITAVKGATATNINVNNGKLIINGDVVGANLYLNDGQLEVGGDLTLAAVKEMLSEEALLHVKGDFTVGGTSADTSTMTNGTVKLEGDFILDGFCGYNPTENCKTIFCGSELQSVKGKFNRIYNTSLGNVLIQSANFTMADITGDMPSMTLIGNINLENAGVIKAGSLTLTGNEINTAGSIECTTLKAENADNTITAVKGATATNINVNNGKLIINGDVVGKYLYLNDGQLEVGGDLSLQEIKEMLLERDVLHVKGDFTVGVNVATTGKMSNGSVKLEGDMILNGTYGYAPTKPCVYVFCGDEPQNISGNTYAINQLRVVINTHATETDLTSSYPLKGIYIWDPEYKDGDKYIQLATIATNNTDSYEYTGNNINAALTVNYGESLLKENADYSIEYTNNKAVGTATATVKGINGYKGTYAFEYDITQTSILNAIAEGVSAQVYTGEAITPKVVLTFNGEVLKENTDYKLSYENNVEEGTGEITVKGLGNFTGTRKITFDIVSKESIKVTVINNIEGVVEVLDDYYASSEDIIKLLPAKVTALLDNGEEVELDVTWSCSDYNNAPSASNTFSYTIASDLYGIADGLQTEGEFVIVNKAISSVTIKAEDKTVDYATSVEVDSLFEFGSEAGEANYELLKGGTGSGILNGKTLTIEEPGSFIIKVITSATLNYEAGEATATLTVGLPKILTVIAPQIDSSVLDEYYPDANSVIKTLPKTVSVETDIGQVTMNIEWFCNEYDVNPAAKNTFSWIINPSEYVGYNSDEAEIEGTITLTNFHINEKSIEDMEVFLESDVYEYTGKPIEPKVTIAGLEEGTDYEVSYSDNVNAGTATVTITGKGYYCGSIIKTFTINPCIHNWNAATCTKANICKVCGVTSGSAKGHTYGNWIVTKKATCTAAGSRYKACGCGQKITETIPAAGHNYKVTKVNKKATTKKNGQITKKCTVCTNVVKETTYRAKSISLSKTKFTYNGKTQKPTVVVKDSKGRAISSSNYKVKFSKGCKNAGTYKVTVTLKGQYSGKLTKSFKITKAKPKITASNFTKVKGDKAFSIKPKVSPKGGKVTYKTNNKKVAKVSSKGKVTIKGKGKATITITSASNKNCSKVTKKITVTVK